MIWPGGRLRPTRFVKFRLLSKYCTPSEVVARYALEAGVRVYTALPSALTLVFCVLPSTTVPGWPSLGSNWSSGGEKMSLRWVKLSNPPVKVKRSVCRSVATGCQPRVAVARMRHTSSSLRRNA